MFEIEVAEQRSARLTDLRLSCDRRLKGKGSVHSVLPNQVQPAHSHSCLLG